MALYERHIEQVYESLVSRVLPRYIDFVPTLKTKTERALLERFWSKVDIRSKSCCWNWVAAISGRNTKKDNRHKGSFGIGMETIIAPRFAYMVCVGNPGNLFVCHTCDNSICCNPEHFFLGTNNENMKDMVSKGRQSKLAGFKAVRAKLDEVTASRIIDLRKQGLYYREIAPLVGVSKSSIGHFLTNKTYSEFVRNPNV